MSEQVSDYHKRCAQFVETIRADIGSGYGQGDIEHLLGVTRARLKAWDKLDRNFWYEVKRYRVTSDYETRKIIRDCRRRDLLDWLRYHRRTWKAIAVGGTVGAIAAVIELVIR